MANWYYHDKNGQKQGPINSVQLKTLAAQGIITPDTTITTEKGRGAIAGQIKGLEFPQQMVPPVPPPVPRPVPVPPVVMKIILDGQERVIDKQELYDLAAQGIIQPDTLVNVNGRPFPARQANGIVFGSPKEHPTVPVQKTEVMLPTSQIPDYQKIDCVPVIDENDIGSMYSHPSGGTKINGHIQEELNNPIPWGINGGTVRIVMYDGGIKIEQDQSGWFKEKHLSVPLHNATIHIQYHQQEAGAGAVIVGGIIGGLLGGVSGALAYRCALIADAVYRKENLADYGIPEATEKQWQSVFGYSFKKKLDSKSISNTKFHLYYDERSEQFVLAFAGTLPTQMKDWWNNIQQFSGKDTPYYEQAIEIAELIQPAYRDKVMVTGHSLGGGLATTAAIAVKLKAVVFNPPFIHKNTLAKFDADNVEFAKQSVQRFVVNDEILHSVNQLTGVLRDELIPVGEKFALQGSGTDVSATGTMTGAAIASILGLGAFKETAGRALQKGIALHSMPEVLGGLVRYHFAE
ncbi:MAG: GYF domain-containing protein [Planctomycetaceae bacterium]|jgi:hypothetical protein|nr:GYF domain-containing protein [Planctomycetaceae bacterium]